MIWRSTGIAGDVAMIEVISRNVVSHWSAIVPILRETSVINAAMRVHIDSVME